MAVTGCQPEKEEPRKPNVIILYTDDMGIGDASYTGGEVTPTPHIDKMANDGKIFTQYYTPAPVCSPSRVGVFTGTYHIRWNINTFLSFVKWNKKTEQSDYFVPEAPNMARMFRQAGYKTAHYGKWHMGGGRDVESPTLDQYGFDDFRSTWESPNPDPLLTSGNWIWRPGDSVKRWNRTAYFVDQTLTFLRENPDKPCFINLWPDDVHTPWVPNQNIQNDGEKDWFNLPPLKLVMVEYDRQVGRLLDGLKELGLEEKTLVIFTSDNGPSPSFQRLRTNGLRGVKNSIYEGGVNMPFIAWWPGTIEGGQTDNKSVIASIDLLPSLAGLIGYDLKQQLVDGENILSALLGSEKYTRKNDLYFEYGRNPTFNFPIDSMDKSPHLAVRNGQWKLLATSDGSIAELYDLAIDPTESKSVADQHPQHTAKLTSQLLSWYKATDKSEVSDIRSIHISSKK